MGKSNDQPQGNNVISMEARARAAAKIDQIETYWNMVRGKRLVPSRSEIDPRGLDGVLSHAFILERITGGLARFRIAGSHLSDLTGLELRQMPFSAFFLPGSREILSDALQAVFDEPSLVRLAVSSPGGFGREALQGELILLPLRSDLGDVDRVLGGLVLDGKIGHAPRRIEIVGQSRRSLTGYAGPAQVSKQKPDGKTLARPGTRPRDTARAHLRLVVTNE